MHYKPGTVTHPTNISDMVLPNSPSAEIDCLVLNHSENNILAKMLNYYILNIF